MGLGFFIDGLAIGFSIALPVGPVGLLCIQRTLKGGRIPGIASGLGAAGADAVYGCIAAFGLQAIADLLLEHRNWVQPIGGVILVLMGLRILIGHQAEVVSDTGRVSTSGKGLIGNFISTFVLTLTNPISLLAFTAIFAGLGYTGNKNGMITALLLVAGVFVGSAVWWVGLAFMAGHLRSRMNLRWMTRFQKFAGMAILVLGVISLAGGFASSKLSHKSSQRQHTQDASSTVRLSMAPFPGSS